MFSVVNFLFLCKVGIAFHSTVYPKKYAHSFSFAVLCCGYTLTDFPISIRLTSLALWQSNDCPSASKATLMNMDKYFMWIHYERLHNHNKAKHNKTVCIFLGIHCNPLVTGESIRLTSLALWQSNDCPSASKATLMNMDKYFMWINYERLHNHNKAKHNKTYAYFLGYTVIHWWQVNNLIWYHDISFNTNLHVNSMKPEQNGQYFIDYYQISDIRCTKSISSYVSCLVLQLCLPNPLKPGIKWRMKMVLQLHLSDQQFYCLLGCDLY